MTDYRALSSALVDIAKQAGDAILKHYEGVVSIEIKADNSPVTDADIAAHTIITNALKKLTPDIPIISEENDAFLHFSELPNRFWLVDPLDGTKSFIKKTGEFTVNIGLIEEKKPVMGVVYVPVKGDMYYTGDDGAAYQKMYNHPKPRKIQVRSPAKDGVVVVASHSHRTPETDAYIKTLKVKELISAASSLKFCVIAAGGADVYPRMGPTMEWDTAAAHAILEAAGGSVCTLEGAPFTYGKPDFKNGYFIARGARV
ncbi:MAG: 3'(2'),5'-bisphosphate nucleotidase [Proteobacteria bacterium]|nr:3'(2'),5'-bisphosphate nucleotidase [Pseudomonadota bacterium]